MTFSILARDPDTGAIGGAAATGSLCVGGWVLRGELSSGMSASQGAAPSTFWGEDVLQRMQTGMASKDAIKDVTSRDDGKAHRQLAAIDLRGNAGCFTGEENQDVKGSLIFSNGVVAGNMLANDQVLSAMADAFRDLSEDFERRLLTALKAGQAAGGDSRGLLSAAMLVLHSDRPPLNLRIDHVPNDPIGALEELYRKATTGDYARWARQVPVFSDKERVLD